MSSIKHLVAVAISILAAGAALRPHAAGAQTTGPDWLKKPTKEALVAVWPSAALKRGKGGKAIIRCMVTSHGMLRDCVVEKETPAGAGFGAAALALTPQFLMRPAMAEGKPVSGEVRIPITFPSFNADVRAEMSTPGGSFGTTQRVASNVPWMAAPSIADVLAAYPEPARTQRLAGRATLSCTITKQGRLASCDDIMEEPRGKGFGKAAKSLSAKFLAPAQVGEASLVGAMVQLQVGFVLDAEGAVVTGKPNWTGGPTNKSARKSFPERALKAGQTSGRAVLSCSVTAEGSLTDCQVQTETPSGLGIGEGAVQLSQTFRMSLWTNEGLPIVGGRIKVPVRYESMAPDAPQQP